MKRALLMGRGKESMKEDSRELQIKLRALARNTGRELVAPSYCFLLYN